ncbi:MAG: WGxxGxxG family protein [Thermomicrobiales bacterium]
MTSNLMKTGRVATLSIALLIGSLGVNTVMAQTATETPTPTTQTQEKKDSGFDDWGLLGLLGLLGLAGLAGLRKRPERTIERTVDRPVNTRTQV